MTESWNMPFPGSLRFWSITVLWEVVDAVQGKPEELRTYGCRGCGEIEYLKCDLPEEPDRMRVA